VPLLLMLLLLLLLLQGPLNCMQSDCLDQGGQMIHSKMMHFGFA
jgi:hypothetical protein